MTDKQIRQTYDRIQLPPGAMDRIQREIEAELDMPMNQKRIVLKPRKKRWLPVIAAAAALALLILGILGLRSHREQQGTGTVLLPAAQPGEIENAVIISPSPEAYNDFVDDVYYHALYANTLQLYRSAIEESLDADACRDLGISELCGRYTGADADCFLGYALEDLNGDGVPELLIGEVGSRSEQEQMILDLYTLVDNSPYKYAESREDSLCFDCGGGLIRIESHTIGEKTAMDSWTLYDLSGYPKRLVATLSVCPDWDMPSYLIPAEPGDSETEEKGVVEVPITWEEAGAWRQKHCSVTVSHSYTPFVAGLTSEHRTTQLSMEQRKEQQLLLNEMSKREGSFALTDYATREPGGVVKLLDQLGQYAELYGLSRNQLKTLLLGRENLDGAGAEAYAALMGKLYRLNPRDFLEAWHESGEPDLLMQEVTLCDTRKKSADWLQERWRFVQAAEERGVDANEILSLIRRTEDQTTELGSQIANNGTLSEEEALALSQQRCQLWDLCMDQILSMIEPGLTEDELEWLQYNQSEWTKRMGWSIDKNTKDLEGDALLRATYDSRSDLVRKRVYEITQFFPSYVVLY